MADNQPQHTPYHIAWVDNIHILCWLIKDTCWALLWRPLGMMMILPTMGVALYILWRSKHRRAELFHNIAICLWIAANSLWMSGEFFQKELRPYAVGIFAVGLTVLLVYYILFFASDRKKAKSAEVTID
jgi:hypothetical protein